MLQHFHIHISHVTIVGLHFVSYSASFLTSSGNEIPLSTTSCFIPKNFLHRSVKEGNVFGLTCDEYVSSTLQPATETSPTSIISGKNPFGFFLCWGIVNSKSKNKIVVHPYDPFLIIFVIPFYLTLLHEQARMLIPF